MAYLLPLRIFIPENSSSINIPTTTVITRVTRSQTADVFEANFNCISIYKYKANDHLTKTDNNCCLDAKSC